MIKGNVFKMRMSRPELDTLINEFIYKSKRGENPSYIIMNKTTNEAFAYAILAQKKYYSTNYHDAFYTYRGIPTAIDDCLEDGEVRIL